LEWVRFEPAAQLLERWRQLELFMAPPTRHALGCIAAGWDRIAERLIAGPTAPSVGLSIEGFSGIRMIPLLTPTLPPAQHTNAVLIGHQRMVVVDPATYDDGERDKLLSVIAAERANGATLEAVVLSHHHVDHTGSAAWLAERLGLPVWAHPVTQELLAGQVPIARTLEEGDRIDLGADAIGRPFWLRVLFTPGHAPGHIVLLDERPGARAMVVGDMVASIGTIVIDPPEGNMRQYLASLERLLALEPRILFPAHGAAIAPGTVKLTEYLAHRRMREALVLNALTVAGGAAEPEALVATAYADTPPELHPLALRSLLAHLEKLVEEGAAHRRDGRYEAIRAG
jgi:glyoxylase-like metal-dependent hydrolase (beta-lactamase superfamily II)